MLCVNLHSHALAMGAQVSKQALLGCSSRICLTITLITQWVRAALKVKPKNMSYQYDEKQLDYSNCHLIMLTISETDQMYI